MRPCVTPERGNHPADPEMQWSQSGPQEAEREVCAIRTWLPFWLCCPLAVRPWVHYAIFPQVSFSVEWRWKFGLRS